MKLKFFNCLIAIFAFLFIVPIVTFAESNTISNSLNNEIQSNNIIDNNNIEVNNTTVNNVTNNENVENSITSNNVISNSTIENITNSTTNQTVENTNTTQESTSYNIKYESHIQDIGWQNSVIDGETSGTTGQSKRIEAIKIKLSDTTANITYKAHVQDIGWQNWVSDGEMSGTTGKSKRIEAIQIKLNNMPNYSVEYRVHVQDIGWQDWVCDGEISGTTGQSKRIEAIQIRIVKITPKARICIDTPINNQAITFHDLKISGWKMVNVDNTKLIVYLDDNILSNNITYTTRNDVISAVKGYGTLYNNTPGFNLTIENKDLTYGSHTIKIELMSNDNKLLTEETKTIQVNNTIGVSYQSHIQDIGWQNSVIDGELSGTTGQSKRIEAIKINLLGTLASHGSISYRTHVSNIGWQDIVSNGEISGTTGQSRKVEAIIIKLNGLENYSVKYRVHIQDIGWQDWKYDGEMAGTTGQAKRIEAIEIQIIPKFEKTRFSGIDVSNHNQTIDWSQVKSSGIDFAIIRCGYGEDISEQDDAQFIRNISECEKLNIPYGVYLYSYALSVDMATSEVNHISRLLSSTIGTKNPSFGVWFDMEDGDGYKTRHNALDGGTLVGICESFCNQMISKGYDCGIYGSLNWFNNTDLLNNVRLIGYAKWIAEWNEQESCTYTEPYRMWQYTSDGSVPGISTRVDMDIYYK